MPDSTPDRNPHGEIKASKGAALSHPSSGLGSDQSVNVPAFPADSGSPQMRIGEFPRRFKKWGDLWILDTHSETAALYRRTDGSDTVGYSVLRFRVRTVDRKTFGNTSPAGSFRIPAPGDWGRYAWDFTRRGRERAERKFEEVSAADRDGERGGGDA